MTAQPTSAEWFDRATRVIPGGVNSPVRAFGSVGGNPLYVVRGKGAVVTTAEGRDLIDFCGSWGPLILGHARAEVLEAISRAAANGTTFGINTTAEVEFAELLTSAVPSMEMVRLVSSGTEAAMTAARLARGVTGRRRVIKFDGCYHGHADGMLVAAGSGLLTGGIGSSAGISPSIAAEVFVPQYNDLAAVEDIVRNHGSELAAILVEPIAANMGLVLPDPGFLQGLRAAADRCGALLVFDEVITGFRLGPTSYGTLCGVVPDLTCLGKIVGGGMPLAAIGGKAAHMRQLAPLGRVYQAGTLSGNPVAVAAGMTTLRLLQSENPYPRIERLAAKIAAALNAAAASAGIAFHCVQAGSMFTPFFANGPFRGMQDVKRADAAAYGRFFRGMLAAGFYLPPSQFEAAFVSAAHSDAQVDAFIAAAARVLTERGA